MSTALPNHPDKVPTEMISLVTGTMMDAVDIPMDPSKFIPWNPIFEMSMFKLSVVSNMKVGDKLSYIYDAGGTRHSPAARCYFGILPKVYHKFYIICGSGVTGLMEFRREFDVNSDNTPLVRHVQPFEGTTCVDLELDVRLYQGSNPMYSYLSKDDLSKSFPLIVELRALNTGVLYPNNISVLHFVSIGHSDVKYPIGLNYMPAAENLVGFQL